MNNLYENLKKKLITLQNSRKDFLNIKTQKIKLINISNQKTNEIKIKNLLSDELTEIDQQIESLTSIIETSKNIGNLIINPVSEKEIILKNVEDVIQVLETQNELKKIIKELDIEINIEKKIEIILKARELLNKNGNILNDYNEEIIKKSKDVLSYLDTNYNSYKEKIMKTYDNEDKIKDKEELKEKEKEIKDNIKEMEKNSTLIYTLSNQKEYLINFFRFLGEHIQQSLCSINFIESVDNQIKKLKMINDSNNINTNKNDEIKEDIIKLSNILKSKLQKIFLKISHFIQERQKKCIILDSNNINKEDENNNEFSLLYQLLNILINSLEPYLIKMIKYLIVLIEIMEKYNEIFSHDFICVESSFIIAICEKFKFYITILNAKIEKYYNIKSNSNCQINLFLNNFNSILYDIGEKYCSNELLFMKNNIIKLFEDESSSYKDLLLSLLDSNYDELSGNILNYIEDIFYILKTSGERAISTLNLQISLGIINHIKVILNEDLYYLLDFKISTNLGLEEDINNINFDNFKLATKNIKYFCNDLPSLKDKNIYSNLFLISCLNSIEQTKENIPLLLENLKSVIYQNIINSKIFDSSLIKLNTEEEDIEIKYFKNNELEMINFAFSDINLIINRYTEFIKHKLKLIFEHLYYEINSIIDILNNTNYVISQSNMNTIEMSETFSNKFISETKKYLKQWKNQLTENVFSVFIEFYAEYATGYIEQILKRKKYNNYGVILLQKDINKICNFLQSNLMANIRDKFNRLFSFIKILNFESINELEEHRKKYGDITMAQNEIDFIFTLKV
jgi:hypothetical protein